jgi:hypothetical protein
MTACLDLDPDALAAGDLGQRIDLCLAKGTDLPQIVLSLQNDDGSYVNVTGSNITAEIRKSRSQTNPDAAFVVGAGPVDITLDLPASASATLTAGADLRDAAGLYTWRCLITFNTGAKRVLAWGELRVVQL